MSVLVIFILFFFHIQLQQTEAVCSMPLFSVFLVPQKGKMNQIWLCYWPPVRETWGCLVRSKLLASTYRDLLITPLHAVRVLYVSCIMDLDGGRDPKGLFKKNQTSIAN